MTNNIELEFFNTFGIEPKIEKYCYWECKKPELKDVACESPCNFNITNIFYPEITDRKLLEMICIFSQHCNFGRWNKYAMHSIDDFEYIMLSQLIEYQNKRYTYGIKEKIQSLFKENQ